MVRDRDSLKFTAITGPLLHNAPYAAKLVSLKIIKQQIFM